MYIYLHFPNGTTTLTDGIQSGYEYTRHDNLITAHIQHNHYHIYIDQHSITATYKYIAVRYQRGYSIGRNSYAWASKDNYKGSERVHLQTLQDMIQELIEYRTIDGLDVDYWRISQLLNAMLD